jgi:AcrR family transcriptional regulator
VTRPRLDRTAVIDAACQMADERGLPATTLTALAGELGIRTPSLYRHVDSLAALVEAIATRALDDLRGHLADAAAGRSGPDAVHAVATAYRRYAHEHPGRYEATTAFAVSQGHDAFRDAAAGILEVLSATLRHWHLGDDAEVDAIRGLRAALHGFVAIERAGGFAMDRSVDRSFAALVDSLIAGLDRTPDRAPTTA